MWCHDSSVSKVSRQSRFDSKQQELDIFFRPRPDKKYLKTVVSIDKRILVKILLLVCKFYVEI
jgi:hypothetical protein